MNGETERRHREDDVIPGDILPQADGTTPPGQMETRTRVIVDRPASIGQPIVDRVETTSLGASGLSESVQINLTFAPGCDHVLHTGSEVGATCADGCGRLLCTVCAAKEENVCRICRRPVAGQCQRRPWLAPELGVLCRRCWRRWWMKELAIGGAVVIGVLIALSLFLGFLTQE